MITFIGFTEGGIAVGTIAAYIQSIIGNVSKDSLFAILQSAGAKGIITKVIVGASVVVVVAVAVYGGYKYYKFVQGKGQDGGDKGDGVVSSLV
jgi:hypothetical protein